MNSHTAFIQPTLFGDPERSGRQKDIVRATAKIVLGVLENVDYGFGDGDPSRAIMIAAILSLLKYPGVVRMWEIALAQHKVATDSELAEELAKCKGDVCNIETVARAARKVIEKHPAIAAKTQYKTEHVLKKRTTRNGRKRRRASQH
jgi:hypothetical protein